MRLIDGINRGDIELPDHEGTLQFFARLLLPIYVPEASAHDGGGVGQRQMGRPITKPQPKPRRTAEVPTPPERTDLPDHLAIRERAAMAASIERGEVRPWID